VLPALVAGPQVGDERPQHRRQGIPSINQRSVESGPEWIAPTRRFRNHQAADQMESSSSYRPKISRETRLLLMAGAAAVALLWVLARIRFDDRPVTPNPVTPVLSQLNAGANYDALASEVADLQGRLLSSLVFVEVARESPTADHSPYRLTGLRWRDDLAIVLLPAGYRVGTRSNLNVRGLDPATRLAVVSVPDQTVAFAPTSWTPRRTQQPRYLTASMAARTGVSLRPTFVGSLVPTDGVAWPGMMWAVPSGTDLVPGSFLFTTTGEFAGLAVAGGDGLAVIPGATVLAEADRLVSAPPKPAGTIAVDVQALTEPVASLTGAQAGVVVTWLRRNGPASGTLTVGDVIEAIDGREPVNLQQWDARMSRLAAGETLTLRVRRGGEVREASIEVAAISAGAGSDALGLVLRRRAGVGAEVASVQRTSVADRAGLSTGDIITLFGDVEAPSPSQVERSFAALRPGDRVMVAVTRGETHYVTALGR